MWIIPAGFSRSVLGLADWTLGSTPLFEALEQSATWRGKRMPAPFWSRAWKRAIWLRHLSGRIWPPSTADAGVESWISSWRASLAPRFLPPGNEQAQTMHDGSGQILRRSLEPSHPAWCFSKTCRASSRGWASPSVAYAAGLVDGEGSITIQRRGTPQYALCLAVEMDMGKAAQSLNTLLWLFGGRVQQNRRNRQQGRAATAVWRVHGAEAACALAVLVPVLQTKRAQAELAIHLFKQESCLPRMKNGKRLWTPERLRTWRNAYEALRSLNARGDQPLPDGAIAVLVGDLWLTRIDATLLEEAHWETFSGPWPSSGSLRNGTCFERPTSAHRTSGYGSSCWPTAATTDAIRLWPTPNVPEGGRTSNTTDRREDGSKRQIDLGALASLWLSRQVRQTTTPGPPSLTSGPNSPRRLNPLFVEWLMSWPMHWTALPARWTRASTDCGLAGTGLSRRRPRSRTTHC